MYYPDKIHGYVRKLANAPIEPERERVNVITRKFTSGVKTLMASLGSYTGKSDENSNSRSQSRNSTLRQDHSRAPTMAADEQTYLNERTITTIVEEVEEVAHI